MNKPSITVKDPSQIQNACKWLQGMLGKGLPSGPVIVELKRESRTEKQNRYFWPLLECFAQQREYLGKMRTKEEWKLVMVSAYKNDFNNMILGLRGEVINLNLSSSELTKPEFCELIEMIHAEGSEWGIQWTDRAMQAYEEATQ